MPEYPILSTIHSPEDIKQLNHQSLRNLSVEISTANIIKNEIIVREDGILNLLKNINNVKNPIANHIDGGVQKKDNIVNINTPIKLPNKLYP